MHRTLWLFGASLVAGGMLLLISLVGLVVWPAVLDPLLAWLPQGSPAWLTTPRIAVAVALAGVVLGSLGVLVVRRQADRLRLERRLAEDRLRRVHLYRESARQEPFIGPDRGDGRDDLRHRRVA